MDLQTYYNETSFEINAQVGADDEDEPFDPKILLVLVPVFLLIGAMLLEGHCHRGWKSAQEELKIKQDNEKRKGIERRISIKKIIASSSTDEENGEHKTRSLSIASNSTISIDIDDESNCCHICLEPFKEDEQIASSTNNNCLHEFHLDCITQWLIKEVSGGKCPVCREDYIENDLKDVDIC